MKRNTIGICSKCGKESIIRDHHYKGYNTDETKPYCLSCDRKAHLKARTEGKCIIPSNETRRLSINSANRRSHTIINIESLNMMPYVQLMEQIIYNKNTENITCITSFFASNRTHILYIDI